MILYLDSSALVKRYILENGAPQVNQWFDEAQAVVTGLITRAEVPAAITRAQIMKMVSPQEAEAALDLFRSEWESFQRLPIQENTVIRADLLACKHHLRGFDAVHLACALIWQETLGLPVKIATFDVNQGKAARNEGLEVLTA